MDYPIQVVTVHAVTDDDQAAAFYTHHGFALDVD